MHKTINLNELLRKYFLLFKHIAEDQTSGTSSENEWYNE